MFIHTTQLAVIGQSRDISLAARLALQSKVWHSHILGFSFGLLTELAKYMLIRISLNFSMLLVSTN